MQKGHTPEGIHWCVAGLVNHCKTGAVYPTELSLRALGGKGLSGGKGYLDVLMCQLEMGLEIKRWADANKCERRVLSTLENWGVGADAYRRDVGLRGTGLVDDSPADSTFIALLLPSSQALLKLYEDTGTQKCLHLFALMYLFCQTYLRVVN